MDFATLVGLAVSFILVGEALSLGGDFSLFVNFPALLIVVGGTLGATITNFPPREIARALKESFQTITRRPPPTGQVLDQFMDFSYLARREGILAIEPLLAEMQDPYLRKGLQLTVDGLEPETIRNIMTTEIDNAHARHGVGVDLFNAMGSYAPALGMIGTVIGLVKMLRNMSDPSSIGPAMAVALITTFYGAVLAHLVFLPVCGKLKHRARQRNHIMEMQLAGILCIAKGENPRILREVLEGYQVQGERRRQDTNHFERA